MINNIISNSVKYMGHPDGVIDIRLLDEGESVKIEIEDDGKGIASKDIGNIFERFYRTDSSRNSLQGGSGIGLSIVKKLLRIMEAMFGLPARKEKGPVCILCCANTWNRQMKLSFRKC